MTGPDTVCSNDSFKMTTQFSPSLAQFHGVLTPPELFPSGTPKFQPRRLISLPLPKDLSLVLNKICSLVNSEGRKKNSIQSVSLIVKEIARFVFLFFSKVFVM